jgi:hypothetical protein
MPGSYRTQVKAPDGAWYGLNEDAGRWEPLTEPEAVETTIEPYERFPPARQEPPLMTPSAHHTVHFKTSYSDRAHAFNLRVRWISGLAALSVVLAMIKFSDVPLLSWGALFWFWTTYAVVWTIAYVLDMFISPDGVALLHTLFNWYYLYKEQRERHSYYRKEHG